MDAAHDRVLVEPLGERKLDEDAVHARIGVEPIDQLEERGLVERRASPTDRRSNALVLTTAGESLLKQLKRRVKAHEARIAAAMAPRESEALVDILTRIRTRLHARARK